MKRLALPSFCAFLAIGFALTAHADVMYTSQAAFDAASTAVSTVTFNGIAPAGGFTGESNPFTLSGATFATNSGQITNITDAAYYPTTFPGYGYATYGDGGFITVNGASATNILTIDFAPSTAVAFDFGGIFGPGSADLLLSDGYSAVLSTTTSVTGTGSLSFFGFTSATPISSITLTFDNTGNNGAVDNVAFGSALAATPEPSSIALLLTGLCAGAGMMRRRLARI